MEHSRTDGELRQELTGLKERIASNPGDMHARLARARILQAQGQLERALEEVKYILAKPGDLRHEAFASAVRWLDKGGRRPQAEKTCARALREFPNSLPLLRMRHRFYGGTNRPGSHILKATSPKDIPAHQCINNALDLAKLGFLDAARRYLEKATWAKTESTKPLQDQGENNHTAEAVELEIAIQEGNVNHARELLQAGPDRLGLTPSDCVLAWLRAGCIDEAMQVACDYPSQEPHSICHLLPYWLGEELPDEPSEALSAEVQHVQWAITGDWASLARVPLENASAHSTILAIEAQMRLVKDQEATRVDPEMWIQRESIIPMSVWKALWPLVGRFVSPTHSRDDVISVTERSRFGEALNRLAQQGDYHPAVDLLRPMVTSSHEVASNAARTFAPMARWPESVTQSPLDHMGRIQSEAFSLLDQLRGNRGPFISWRDEEGTPRVHFPHPSARRELADLRSALDLVPIEEVIEGYERLFDRYRDDPLCWTYRGEVLLWSGEYERGIQDLEHALSMDASTRWAWIGLAGGHVFLGNPEKALEVLAEAEVQVDHFNRENALGYRGEAHLLMNQPERARDVLLEAVEHRPTRLSAWLLLAKAKIELGEPSSSILDAIASAYPELWQDFTLDQTDSPAVIDSILKGMRGNRSSGLITYYSPDGSFCSENRTHPILPNEAEGQ